MGWRCGGCGKGQGAVSPGLTLALDRRQPEVSGDYAGGPGVVKIAAEVTPASLEGLCSMPTTDGGMLVIELPRSSGRFLVSPQPGNSAPVAVVDDRLEAEVGQDLVLDASSSCDPDGDGITYKWSLDYRPYRSLAAIDGSDRARAVLSLDRFGDYKVVVTVSDGHKQDSKQILVHAAAVVTEREETDSLEPGAEADADTGPEADAEVDQDQDAQPASDTSEGWGCGC